MLSALFSVLSLSIAECNANRFAIWNDDEKPKPLYSINFNEFCFLFGLFYLRAIAMDNILFADDTTPFIEGTDITHLTNMWRNSN